MLNITTAHRKLSTSSGRLPATKARPEVTQLIPMAGRSGKLSPVRSISKGEQSCPAQAKQKVVQDAKGYTRPLNLVRALLSFDRSTALITARATAGRRFDDLQSSSTCHASHQSVVNSRDVGLCRFCGRQSTDSFTLNKQDTRLAVKECRCILPFMLWLLRGFLLCEKKDDES